MSRALWSITLAGLSVAAVSGCAQVEIAAPAHDRPVGTPVSQEQSFVDRLPEKARKERAFYEQPNSWFASRLDGPPVRIDGQTLHPKLQYEFQERARARAESGIDYNKWLFDKWATLDGRAALRAAVDVNWTAKAYDVGTLASIRDYSIAGPNGEIPVRLYQPEKAGPLPALVYFHGGGFLMASVAAVEPQAKILARKGGIIVVSVNYSLSPEHVFPAAQQDALAAYRWVVDNAAALGIDRARIGVGGDSAGGNLAAVVTEEALRTGGPVPKAQLLYYPFLDTDFDGYRSYKLFGDGFGLNRQFIERATAMVFAKPEDQHHRWVTLNESVLPTKHPATIIASPGFDPLRDQGRRFAKELEKSGTDVVLLQYPRLNHGFLEASATIDDARKACFETATLIGATLRK